MTTVGNWYVRIPSNISLDIYTNTAKIATIVFCSLIVAALLLPLVEYFVRGEGVALFVNGFRATFLMLSMTMFGMLLRNLVVRRKEFAMTHETVYKVLRELLYEHKIDLYTRGTNPDNADLIDEYFSNIRRKKSRVNSSASDHGYCQQEAAELVSKLK